MKKNVAVLILLMGSFLFFACVTPQGPSSPLPPMPEKFSLRPPPQEIIVTVKSADDVKVDVEQKGDEIHRGMEVQNPEGELSTNTWISSKSQRAFTKISSGIDVYDVHNLWRDINWLIENTNIKDLYIFINSPGGNAFAGLAMADEIVRAKNNGFKVRGFASGIVASAAVPIFASCTERVAAPGTIFLVHEAQLFKLFAQESRSDIRAQNELMELLEDKYINYLVAGSKLTKEEWIQKETRTSWFNAEKALEWGLVDRIE